MMGRRKIAGREDSYQLPGDCILRPKWTEYLIAAANSERRHAHHFNGIDAQQHWCAIHTALLNDSLCIQVADQPLLSSRELADRKRPLAASPGGNAPRAICIEPGILLKPHLQQPVRIGDK